jgi:hypothetical protein
MFPAVVVSIDSKTAIPLAERPEIGASATRRRRADALRQVALLVWIRRRWRPLRQFRRFAQFDFCAILFRSNKYCSPGGQ